MKRESASRLQGSIGVPYGARTARDAYIEARDAQNVGEDSPYIDTEEPHVRCALRIATQVCNSVETDLRADLIARMAAAYLRGRWRP